MFYAILQDMKVGADQGINTSNWEQYGVTVTMDEKTLVYNPDETTNINIHPYKKVVFNLATADSTTTEKQNTLDQDKQKNAYLYKLNDLMSTRDPMGDCLKHKAEPTPTPVVQTKVNPKTGVALPIAAGAAVLVLALASYMVVRKKNLFRSI